MKRLFFRRILAALLLILLGTGVQARPSGVAAADRPLKILAIGNSFSQDAVEQYLWNLFDAAGIDAVIGNMYIGGCPLERHWNNAAGDTAAYTYRKIVDGVRTETKEMTLGRALGDEEWDIVTLQQASGKSGRYVTYQPYLRDQIAYVTRLAANPGLKIYFHQTWAYAENAKHQEFKLYGNSQRKMYESILLSTRCAMDDSPQLCGIIPSGTAIQNARTTPQGDTAVTRLPAHGSKRCRGGRSRATHTLRRRSLRSRNAGRSWRRIMPWSVPLRSRPTRTCSSRSGWTACWR